MKTRIALFSGAMAPMVVAMISVGNLSTSAAQQAAPVGPEHLAVRARWL